jgi:AraC-like DNA-binding protein
MEHPPSDAEYTRQPARGALAALAEDFWVQEAPPDQRPTTPTVVAPGPSVDLLLCFGDPFERVADGRVTRLSAAHAVGPRTRALTVRATGRTGLVITRLHPWVAERLIGRSPTGLVDRIIDLDDLVAPSRVATVLDRIGEARRAAAKIEAVGAWLEDVLDDRPTDPLVTAAVRRIGASAGGLPVSDLARGLHISERQLRRRFRAASGLGPKRFSRIVRFQVAVGLLRAGRSWCDVLERCAFFDQAHLIRELQAMAGVTPPAVQRSATTPLSAYFNRGDASALYGTAYL